MASLVDLVDEAWLPVEGRSAEGIRPDILAQTEWGPLAIEIAVTHHVDDHKLKKLKRMDLATVEFNLSDLDRIDFSILESILFEENGRARWKYHPREAEAKRNVSEELDAAIDEANRQFEKRLVVEAAAVRRRALSVGAHRNDLSQEFIGQIAANWRQSGNIPGQPSATKTAERARRARFRMLSEPEKLETLTKALSSLDVPSAPIETRGAGSFGVQDDRIWQLALYGWIEKKRARYGSIIQIDDCLRFLAECFDMNSESKTANAEAVYDYLMSLADRGYLHPPTCAVFHIRHNADPHS
ncbi:MAG: hypothetical protein IE917_03930 [Betaproteobacteria bacterium]|nr:hypothetical protein [Betaproteobacteria bacterium]